LIFKINLEEKDMYILLDKQSDRNYDFVPASASVSLVLFQAFLEQQVFGKYVNPYKFNAKELDSETGLYYYGARYYNPRLSIWYGVDPLGEKMPSWCHMFIHLIILLNMLIRMAEDLKI